MSKLCQHLLCAVLMAASLLFVASPATAAPLASTSNTANVATAQTEKPVELDKLWSHGGSAVMVTALGMLFIAVSLFNLYYLLSKKKIWRRQGRGQS